MSEEHRREEDEQLGETALLRDSFTALREIHSGSNEDRAAATRRAILLRAMKERRRRAIVVRLALPLAAVLAVSTAWAAATGRLPRIYTALLETLHLAPPHEHPTTASTPTTASFTNGRSVAPPPLDTNPLAAPPPSASDEPAASPVSSPVAMGTFGRSPPPPAPTSRTTTVASPPTSPPSSTASSAVTTTVDREESLYRTAHEAHFVTRDSSRALGAWDAYLAAYPQGRFAPEARYNRAISLVRLNRRDEAKNALRPFADGKEVGGYRQREAKDLLDAMGD